MANQCGTAEKNPDPAANPSKPNPQHRWWLRPQVWGVGWMIWFGTLFVLSSMSHPGPEIHIDGIDKVEHTAFFAAGGMCLVLWRALRGKPDVAAALAGFRWGRLALLALVIGGSVGWFDEWHQTFTPGRSGLDVHDWLADITGSLLATPCAWLALRIAGRFGA